MAELAFESSFLSDVLLPAALAVIMLGMGLSLTGADFLRVRERPRAVIVGVLAQIVVLPALAVGVALACVHWLGWNAALATGLLLLACCPGGATSNLLTHLARADSALSVTLTSITSFVSPLATPAAFLLGTTLVLGEGERVTLGFLDMVVVVAMIVVAPILLGMLARRRWPAFARRVERPVRIASIALFVAIVGGLIAAHGDVFVEAALLTTPGTLALNLVALAAGYALARVAGVKLSSARAISIEVGFQNATLAITLAITQLAAPEVAIVPAFYSLVMFATGAAIAWMWSRNAIDARAAAPAEDAVAEAGAR